MASASSSAPQAYPFGIHKCVNAIESATVVLVVPNREDVISS